MVIDYGQTPISELNYSYSDMEGSNFASSKMRLSNGGPGTGSYLKNQTATSGQVNKFNHNNTIQEEEEERDSSSKGHNSYSQSSVKEKDSMKKQYGLGLNQLSGGAGMHGSVGASSHMTPSFNSHFGGS